MLAGNEQLSYLEPVEASTLTRFEQVSVARTHAAGLDADGLVTLWGLIRPNSGRTHRGWMIEVPWRWKTIALHDLGLCGVTEQDDVVCVTQGGELLSEVAFPEGFGAPKQLVASLTRSDSAPRPPVRLCALNARGDIACWLEPGHRVEQGSRAISATFEASGALDLDLSSERALCYTVASGRVLCEEREELALGELQDAALGAGFACGIDRQRQAWCVGDDAHTGRLGRGVPLRLDSPTLAAGWHARALSRELARRAQSAR